MRARNALEKTRPSRTFAALALATLAFTAGAFAACGGEQTPPPAKPEPKPEPTAAATETPTATPEPPKPEPTQTADAGPPPPPPASQERPPVLMGPSEELSGIFSISPGAKLVIGDDTTNAVFRIREGSLASAYVITFKLDSKGKSTGAPIGKIYRMIVQIENSAELPTVETQDKPFEFSFPAGNKKDANLAIGAIVDDKKINWTIVAPEKIDDATGMAFFKIKSITNSYMHVTAKPPTAPK